jgi:hypothetical protein
MRRCLVIGIGDGGNELMMRAVRAHSNFADTDVSRCNLADSVLGNQGSDLSCLFSRRPG